jgi:hypothetical protein
MPRIQINNLSNEVQESYLRELSSEEESLQGGILCVLVLCFAAGYGIGCLLR